TNGDATKPVITLFEDDGTIETIPVARFHVETSDASPITGWFLSESAAPPGPLDTGWSSDEPSVYEVANVGELNLHLWVRDAAGNISDGAQLSLNFPYFHYAESFLRSGNDGFTPSNSFQISVFSGNLIQSTFTDPIIGVGYGQGIVMKLTTAGTLQAYSLDRNGNLELVAETPVLTRYFEISRPATGLTAFHYNAGQDFWLAAAVHPFCPLYQLCVRTVRYDPDGHSFQLLDSRSIYTGLITTELRHHQSFLSDDGRHFALYRFSHLYGFTLEDGKIAESYASNPIEYSIVENGAPAAAFSPNLRWVLLIKGIAPGIRSLRFDPTAQINEDAWTRSVWPVVNNSVTDKIYGSLVFLGEEDVLACSDAGVEHLSLDRNSGSLTRIGLVIDAPGILSEKTVYAAPDGIHFIFRHGTQASLFRFDHDTGLATEVYKLPYQDWGRFDRVTFQTNSRGNRPPSIDFKLPGGYSVLTPSGPLYPFRGIITPNLSCEGDLSAAYASNESSRWTMARIDYSDPDATRCGVDNEPASLEIASTSQPSGNSLAIPMNLYKDLQIDADSPFEVRGFLRAIVGDTARRICPGAFRADGRKEALIPLTPKEPGDYSFTVQATDNQGSCEGRAQTTTSTLRFVARNRYDSRPKEFIRRSDYPAPEAPLRYFSLESRHQKGMSPQPFTQFRCEIHSVICALHGQTFLCLDNTHQGPVILTESEHAQCGPPLFFMTRWTSRTGNSGPLSDYKPLYKYYDKADQYWNESWDQPGFNPVTWENTGLDPFSKQDRRGFLFVQSETLIPLDELYRGEWIGYEDL
ncbi:MAG: hypothetical protein KDK33_15210, partial [Leptospiraceae bacterium]|nr:hypothetical protein [Leptospiraceae bacterium]